MKWLKNIGFALLIIALLALPVVWFFIQWGECRDNGFSVMYCIQHCG